MNGWMEVEVWPGHRRGAESGNKWNHQLCNDQRRSRTVAKTLSVTSNDSEPVNFFRHVFFASQVTVPYITRINTWDRDRSEVNLSSSGLMEMQVRDGVVRESCATFIECYE